MGQHPLAAVIGGIPVGRDNPAKIRGAFLYCHSPPRAARLFGLAPQGAWAAIYALAF
jgi:hypothetical protein